MLEYEQAIDNAYSEIKNELQQQLSKLYDDDIIAKHLIEKKIYKFMNEILNSYKDIFKKFVSEVNYNVIYDAYNFFINHFSKFTELLERKENLEKVIEGSVKNVNENFKLFSNDVKKIYKNNLNDIKKYFKNLYREVDEAYYHISIFLFMYKAQPYVKNLREEKLERILKFKREWIIDDEYAIQEYFCDISNQLDKDPNEVDYIELLKALEVNFQKFIEEDPKKFNEFLNKIKLNKKEAKKILVGYICKNLKESRKLDKKDAKRINKLVERYIKVIFNVNIKGRELNNNEMEKIFKLLFDQKRILELEVFRHISRLGYPCIPNATIKTEDERFPEFDIVVLTSSGIKLVEVTVYGEPKEKISEKKENRNKLAMNQILPIIFVCNVSKKEECPKERLYVVPFKDLNTVRDFLERG